jgi:hypothetical protein
MRNGADIPEWAIRGNESREASLSYRSACVFNPTNLACAFPDGMKNAEADAVALETGESPPGHAKLDHGIRASCYFRLPAKSDIALRMGTGKGYAKGVLLSVDLLLGNDERYGFPIVIAHSHGDCPENFLAFETDMPDSAVLIDEGKRAGVQDSL